MPHLTPGRDVVEFGLAIETHLYARLGLLSRFGFITASSMVLVNLMEEDMGRKLAIRILFIAIMAVPGISVGQDNKDTSQQIATGCLRKSATEKTYLLTDEDGKTWDLRSKAVSLSPHVGQIVTVTGTIPSEPKNSNDTSPQNHLLVEKLDVVHESCKQP